MGTTALRASEGTGRREPLGRPPLQRLKRTCRQLACTPPTSKGQTAAIHTSSGNVTEGEVPKRLNYQCPPSRAQVPFPQNVSEFISGIDGPGKRPGRVVVTDPGFRFKRTSYRCVHFQTRRHDNHLHLLYRGRKLPRNSRLASPTGTCLLLLFFPSLFKSGFVVCLCKRRALIPADFFFPHCEKFAHVKVRVMPETAHVASDSL